MSIGIDKYKKMLAGYPKETLEHIRSVGYALVYPDEKMSLGQSDLYAISQITKTSLVPQKQMDAISEKMHSEWCVFEDGELNKMNASHLVEAINQELGQSKKVLEVIKKKKNIFVRFDGDKKEYFLSDDEHSRKARLVRFLTDPVIGVSKSIDSTAEYIALPDDDFRNLEAKKVVLKNTIKEIQRALAERRSSKTLSLEWRSGNTVALKIKDR